MSFRYRRPTLCTLHIAVDFLFDPLKLSFEMAHKVIVPPKKIFVPQFLKQRDSNSYSFPMPILINTNRTTHGPNIYKTSNPKCRLFLKVYQYMYWAAGVYQSEAPDLTSEKVVGTLVLKRGRKYQP